MNQAESKLLVRQIELWPRWCNKVIAALAQEDLPDPDRRSWFLIFKRLARMHRNCLHWADWYDAVPSAELVELWREFVKTGSTVCENQLKIIGAKLESSKLPVRQRCALVNLLLSVMKMCDDFEGYRDEMIAFVSPQIPSGQTGGEQKVNLSQTAGELPEKPRF